MQRKCKPKKKKNLKILKGNTKHWATAKKDSQPIKNIGLPPKNLWAAAKTTGIEKNTIGQP